uniref:Uncharacterized protein n=1 Tax=Molossus molossus TaxID=27622 RepID=A0A7J8JW82_MOLMO|nr:hypothetical protein HJG59_008014 [Molossus molossus]
MHLSDREEILEQVLRPQADTPLPHWNSSQPPDLPRVPRTASQREPEILGHQLFPIVKGNNKQQTEQNQRSGSSSGSHPLIRTVVFAQENLEKCSYPFLTAKQAAQPQRRHHCHWGKVPNTQVSCIRPSCLQHQPSWAVFAPQEKRKEKAENCVLSRQEPGY